MEQEHINQNHLFFFKITETRTSIKQFIAVSRQIFLQKSFTTK